MKKFGFIIYCIFLHTTSSSQEEGCNQKKRTEQITCLNKQFFTFKKNADLKITALENKISEQQKNLDLLNAVHVKNDLQIEEIEQSRAVSYNLQTSIEKNTPVEAKDVNYIPKIIDFNPKDEIVNVKINKAIFIQTQKKVQVFINFNVSAIGYDRNPYIEFLITLPHQDFKFKDKYNLIGMGSTEVMDWLRGESTFTVAAEPNTNYAKIQGKIHRNRLGTSTNVVSFVYEL